MHSRGANRARERAWVKGETEAESVRQKLLGHNKAGRVTRSYGSVVNRQRLADHTTQEANSSRRNPFGRMHDNPPNLVSDYTAAATVVDGNVRMNSTSEEIHHSPDYRCLKARSVTLPPQKWYKHVRIPGVFNRTSPRTNAVHTTKYTIITFLPLNIWEQAHRWANLYFIFIALLNFVPAVEAIGKEIGFIPVIFVLAVTAIKDIFEDYRRYRSDREVNGRLCKIYDW